MPLFQNSVLNKYLSQSNTVLLQQKWELYKSHFLNGTIQQNIRSSKEEQYQGEFLIDLFVTVLGYTKNPAADFNLTTEYKNVKDSKKADGAILFDGKVRAVIELKGTNTVDLGKIESQAFGYKNNQPDCIYVITSNFEKLRLYIDNAVEHIEFNLFTLTQKDFNLLYLLLAKENLSVGLAKKIKDESVSQEDVITKKLYKDYSLFKRSLYQNLVGLNPQYDPLQLFQISQKLLDRFLFIFFAEDRNLLPTNLIFRINKEWRQLQEMRIEVSLYDRYKMYFNDLNSGAKVTLPAFSETASTQKEEHQIFAYNGGLFRKDDILNDIKIDDEVLYEHTQKLSHYDFASEVDVNILGHIFENSLNELDEVKAHLEGQAIDKSKTKRKKDGVFYTPKYITKYIVDNTVGKLCADKKKELDITDDNYQPAKQRSRKRLEQLQHYRKWLLELTICDPACGSGAFLNQALEFLIAEHRYIDELSATYNKDTFVLSDVEGSILENNLFGVDLNEESVEIAKLSLWLRTAQPHRKLNDLSNNIKCGNSLIDDPAVAGDKAFYWQQEFAHIFEKGGFDVVIGNPPYGAKISKNEINSVIERLSDFGLSTSLTDTYFSFYALSLKLLVSENGMLGFITPNTWRLIENALQFRKKIMAKPFMIRQIIHHSEKVFSDAAVDCDTVIIQNSNSMENIAISVNYKSLNVSQHFLEPVYLSNQDYFNLHLTVKHYKLKDKVLRSSKLVKDLFIVKNGIKPYEKGKGKPSQSQETLLLKPYTSTKKNDELFSPLIGGSFFQRYQVTWNNDYWIKYGEWLAAPRDKEIFASKEKLIFRQTSDSIVGTFIDDKYFIRDNTHIILNHPSSRFKLKYLLALLNSRLVNWYYWTINPEKGEAMAQVKAFHLGLLPFKVVSLQNQQNFIQLVDEIISSLNKLRELTQKFQRTIQRKFNLTELPKKLQDWYKLSYAEFIKELGKKKVKLSLTDEAEWEDYFLQEQKKALELKATIDATDKEIDQMVYALYGLTPEEIEIVENS